MQVRLLNVSPLSTVVLAIRKCYESEGRIDSTSKFGYFTLGPKDEELLRRVVSSGHHSTIEHCNFTFDIDGISRGCLQELARHRIASCLSGDNLLYFDMPSGVKNNKRKRNNMSISEFYNKWYFGAKSIPHCTTRTPITIPLRDRLKEMNIRCYDVANKELGHTKIVDIIKTGVKKVYKVKLKNGYSIKLTDDHKILSDKGWITLKEDFKLSMNKKKTLVYWSPENIKIACNGAPLYKSKEWLESKVNVWTIKEIAKYCEVAKITISNWLRKFNLNYSVEFKRKIAAMNLEKGRTEIPWNKGKTYKNGKRKKIRNLETYKRGEQSNLWRGGTTSDRQKICLEVRKYYPDILESCNYLCQLCGGPFTNGSKKGHIHHIDPVWHNVELANNKDNLIALCYDCHKKVHASNLELELLEHYKVHKYMYAFWLKYSNIKMCVPEDRKTPNIKKLSITYSDIETIEYVGEEEVYDLEVESTDHNFVCNGIVVHNCSVKSTRYTLGRIKDSSNLHNREESGKYLVWSQDEDVNQAAISALVNVQKLARQNIPNDQLKYCLPESFKTSLIWTINARSLRNFFDLRLDRRAHWEIRQLAQVIFSLIPTSHRILFEDLNGNRN